MVAASAEPLRVLTDHMRGAVHLLRDSEEADFRDGNTLTDELGDTVPHTVSLADERSMRVLAMLARM